MVIGARMYVQAGAVHFPGGAHTPAGTHRHPQASTGIHRHPHWRVSKTVHTKPHPPQLRTACNIPLIQSTYKSRQISSEENTIKSDSSLYPLQPNSNFDHPQHTPHTQPIHTLPAAMNARIGVGVFVFNSKGEFILGQRKGSHGAGESLILIS